MSYTLANVEHRAMAHASFSIPSLKIRANLSVGNIAKLVFVPIATNPIAEVAEDVGERMWVEIVSVTRGRYVGKLRNKPVMITDLRYGEMVEFSPEHIADWDVSA